MRANGLWIYAAGYPAWQYRSGSKKHEFTLFQLPYIELYIRNYSKHVWIISILWQCIFDAAVTEIYKMKMHAYVAGLPGSLP